MSPPKLRPQKTQGYSGVRLGMGRPSTYNTKIAAKICAKLAEGESLLSICRDGKDMPPASTVREWVLDNRDGFAAQYARARDIGLDHQAEYIIEIADTESDPAKARVMIDARKWHLSKMAPKRYGEKIEHTGSIQVERIVREIVDPQ